MSRCKPRQLQQSSNLPEPIPSKNIAYRAGRGLDARQHAQKQGLEIGGLRDCRMHRVIGSLLTGLQQLQEASGPPTGLSDGTQEGVTIHVEGTGGGDQEPARRQEFDAEPVEPGIGLKTFLLVLTALDEGWGVQDDRIEQPPVVAQSAQDLEGVALDGVNPLAQMIALGVGRDPLQGVQ